MHDWDLSVSDAERTIPGTICGKSPIGDSPYDACDMAGKCVNSGFYDWYAEGYYGIARQ